ncbi:MAG: hypothetical protein AMJ89_04665 [candidate division Zixibacteria bacterium SM23_73]|nr:MAG: hypothetical protein AMJ89_04665 [candidate division Zixibacteria bacterium SM23_73]
MFLLVLVLLLTPLCNSIAESDTPKIILENGFYYVLQPNGEKVRIVKELVPGSLNKAKLSPGGQYVLYTAGNGLGFEGEGRDLFYCKPDGTARTFLYKFEMGLDDWIWLTKDKRNFLIVINKGSMSGPGIWVLDFDKKKLLLRFYGDAVERIEGTECYKMVGIRKEREICADELLRISEQETPEPQVFINWMGDAVYFSTQRDAIFGYKEVLECFTPVYEMLSLKERALYRAIQQGFAHRAAYFPEQSTSLAGDSITFSILAQDSITFSISEMNGRFNLRKKRVEFLDIGGELSLKAFRSPRGKYLGILKTEHTGIKKLIILSKKPDASWENVLTKEFSVDAAVSNLEWSKQDETKIYYSLKEGTVTKDSCVIDLTKTQKK